MRFRFIHSADWHLGKTFGAFPSDLAGELAAARLSVVDRIAEVARNHAARGVLVAGDVFDSDKLATVVMRRALNAMAQHKDVAWLLMPGNHDAAKAGGVWDRIAGFGALPDNVTILRQAAPHSFGDDAVILPAPLMSRHPADDPSQWMDRAATADGVTRIGLAHGPVQGFGSESDAHYKVAPDRAAKAGLAYFALGDWHGLKQVTPKSWYAGTPEPDRFLDNQPGHVLVVEIDNGKLVSVTPVVTAEFSWTKRKNVLASLAELAAIGDEIVGAGKQDALQRGLVSLELSGSLSLAEHVELDRWIEETAGGLRHLEVAKDDLTVRSDDDDLARLSQSPLLQSVARDLAKVAADESDGEAAVARRALIRLFGFAAEADPAAVASSGRAP